MEMSSESSLSATPRVYVARLTSAYASRSCLVSVSRPDGDVYPKAGAVESGTILRYYRNRMMETAVTRPSFVEIATLNNPFNSKRVVDPAPSCADFNGDGSVDCAVGFAARGQDASGALSTTPLGILCITRLCLLPYRLW